MSEKAEMETDSKMNQRRLCGRRIVIAGAASGIGKATARLFAEHGATLALIDRERDGVEEIAQVTGAYGFCADVTDETAVSLAMKQAAQAMGGMDGIVNTVGVMLRGSVLDVEVAEWRRVIDINLTGAYILARSALPWLKTSASSTIVNVGSGQSLLPNSADRTAYSASKGGVLNLTRALAAELAPAIRANTVCPGLVDTPMASGVQGNVGNYALGRMARPEEIAEAILFLTSHESSYVTGAALAVDGGRSFH
ncbi:SDR family NAD(P)-dependent oxidoreductase [Paraburkholderia sp. SIMBA_053]|uniref:SDR family NAD(P)-dependent oxidoreductase n=2 Tax=Bacteria TaxID=2 RepID=UPI00397BE811